jgi:hypothetical protein
MTSYSMKCSDENNRHKLGCFFFFIYLKGGYGMFRFVNQKWTRRFFISHICGWCTAVFNAIWIVYEIRKNRDK